jgi:hypothetical protein
MVFFNLVGFSGISFPPPKSFILFTRIYAEITLLLIPFTIHYAQDVKRHKTTIQVATVLITSTYTGTEVSENKPIIVNFPIVCNF